MKSKFITLVLVTSLMMFGCKGKPEKQNNDWSAESDTQNKDEVHGYHSGGVNPYLLYWMMSQGDRHYYYGGYDNHGNFVTRSSSGFSSFGKSTGGSRSFATHSVSRGGFGSHGFGVGA